MTMRSSIPSSRRTVASDRGFTLVELMIVCIVLVILVGAALKYIAVASQRSRQEQTKVDLTQEGRQFVDQFERDIHQAGYPGCHMFDSYTATCVPGSIPVSSISGPMEQSSVAMTLDYVSNTEVVFEGDTNGDGIVEVVSYRLVDGNGNYPPTTTCPCVLQRSEQNKVSGSVWSAQPTNFSQQLSNVINSGRPAAGAAYGNGLNLAGTTIFGGGGQTNTSYYAAVTTMKDYPLFSAYDQYGTLVTLPRDITVAGDQAFLLESAQNTSQSVIKSIRLTINLLGSATTGYDASNGVRPIVTLAGTGRVNNNN